MVAFKPFVVSSCSRLFYLYNIFMTVAHLHTCEDLDINVSYFMVVSVSQSHASKIKVMHPPIQLFCFSLIIVNSFLMSEWILFSALTIIFCLPFLSLELLFSLSFLSLEADSKDEHFYPSVPHLLPLLLLLLLLLLIHSHISFLFCSFIFPLLSFLGGGKHTSPFPPLNPFLHWLPFLLLCLSNHFRQRV